MNISGRSSFSIVVNLQLTRDLIHINIADNLLVFIEVVGAARAGLA
jgi:hypothetical protein